MEQTSLQKNQESNLSFNVEKYPLVDITRKFAAPIQRLFEAWTTSQMAKEWWGPETFTCPNAKIEARVGGKTILAMKDPEGKVQYGGGTYLEFIPNKRLVMTDQFTDKDGKMMTAKDAGMPGEDWPDTLKITVEFRKIGENESELHLVHEGIPKSMHDDCVQGWSSSFNKLQKLVEKH